MMGSKILIAVFIIVVIGVIILFTASFKKPVSQKSLGITTTILNFLNENSPAIQAIMVLSLVIVTICYAISTSKLVAYTHKSNDRMEKLFVGQNKPLIDVTPFSISQSPGRSHCTTSFKVSNYSGFVAYDIWIDVKYGGKDVYDHAWIEEWIRADNDRKEREKKKVEEEGVEINKPYLSIPNGERIEELRKLKSGKTVTVKLNYKNHKVELLPFFSGSLNLDKIFDLKSNPNSKVRKSYPVFVRVAWRNKKGHVFDEIHKYKLLCTKVGSGLSFTFISEGVISQKNMN